MIWMERQAIELLHAESVAEHGGMPGLRDEALLESALARPLNLHAYQEVTDVLGLASCYAEAIVRNHPFLDGNKRAAFIATMLFAQQNGLRVVAEQASAAAAMIAVAAGDVTRDEFAAWLRTQVAQLI